MGLTALLSGYGVFAAVSGTALLIVPSTVMRFYGVSSLDVVQISLARDLGTVLIGLAVMCWTARTAGPSKAREALILGMAVVNGLWALLAVVAGLSVGGWVIWAEVPFFALVAILFFIAGREPVDGAGVTGLGRHDA